jgi:CBS domain containing-hemolysin-like protein
MLEITLTVVIMLIVSALSSGVEAAIFAVPYSRVRGAIDEKRFGASALLSIKDDMRKPIMTIVIFNNIANVAGPILAGTLAALKFGETWVGVFSGCLTFLVIIFAEILPKTVGERNALTVSLIMARPLLLVSKALTPIIWFIEKIVTPFIGNPRQGITSEEEITILTQLGHEAGIIEEDESELIQRVFKLNDITAWDMMTPRSQIDAFDGSLSLGDVRSKIMQLTHSRIPVYEDSLDKIIGLVSVRELLQAVAVGREDASLSSLVQKAYFVPETTPADDLLVHFQQTHVHLAIVVDSLGNVLGVVSLEDVIEELVGEIIDETDVEPEKIKRISRFEILVDADTDIHRINKFFNTEIPGEGRIGEMLCEAFGSIPQVGESIELHHLRFQVAQGNSQLMQTIRISKPTNPLTPQSGESSTH